MSVTGNDPHIGSYNAPAYNISTAAVGQTWTVSVWVRASVATTGELLLLGADSSGNAFAFPDIGAATINITTEWTRRSFSYTLTQAQSTFIQFRLDGTQTGGTGINIWWDGVQIEQASSSSTFNSMRNPNRTSWNDISGGGYRSTIVSLPAYNSAGYFVFTGTQTVTVTNPLFASQTATNQTWTVSAWLNINDTTDQSLINFGIGLYPSYGTNNSLLYLNAGANDYYTYGGDIGNLGWKYVTFRFNNATGARTIYSNAANISTSGPNNTSTPVALNATSTIASNLRGNLASLEIYNRMLTDDEVTQNFNAFRGKYGV
jgi:hypothetical protein